uniref:NADH-ubiquinone oxidoreductase chain 6 n=1 Tax=Gastrolina depressa TaxID=2041217 RepID=A0A343KIG4_9CUCU|nr:NADH dehydrogenase subunit 6 [Gastrolina depressa]
MLMILMMFYSMIFIMLSHPLSCGMILMLQTILTAMLTGKMNTNFWYSYILFLIMVGGMLILFIYMTSIASNEKFKLNFMLMTMMIIIIMMLLYMITMDMFYMNMKQTININYMSLMKYYNFPNLMLMLLMIIYLFITLIVVVKISKLTYGPLRQKF